MAEKVRTENRGLRTEDERSVLAPQSPFLDFLMQQLYDCHTLEGAIGFDGLEEGIVACPGPGSWINHLEITKRQH